MSLASAIVVVGFGLVLIAFTSVVFATPAIAERFLMRFASSAQTHYVEQIFRLLIGAALVVRSPSMWQPSVFWLVGWAIVVSSVALMLAPWQWHHRFGQRVDRCSVDTSGCMPRGHSHSAHSCSMGSSRVAQPSHNSQRAAAEPRR